MDIEILKKKFIKFLKENNALALYTKERYKWLTLAQTNKEMFENLAAKVPKGKFAEFPFPFEDDCSIRGRIESAISSAFSWADTEQGYDFWYQLSIKWDEWALNHHLWLLEKGKTISKL